MANRRMADIREADICNEHRRGAALGKGSQLGVRLKGAILPRGTMDRPPSSRARDRVEKYRCVERGH
jgi:hypothetical protein